MACCDQFLKIHVFRYRGPHIEATGRHSVYLDPAADGGAPARDVAVKPGNVELIAEDVLV